MTVPATSVPALDLLQFIVTMPLGPLGVERHTPRAGHKGPPRGCARWTETWAGPLPLAKSDTNRACREHFPLGKPASPRHSPLASVCPYRHVSAARRPPAVDHHSACPSSPAPEGRGPFTPSDTHRPFPDHAQAVRNVQGSSAHEPPHPALTRPRRGSLCGEEAERSVDPGGLRGKRAGIRRDALFSSPLWRGGGCCFGPGTSPTFLTPPCWGHHPHSQEHTRALP